MCDKSARWHVAIIMIMMMMIVIIINVIIDIIMKWQ